MHDYTNKKAGNYTILKKLGDGGFASVYLAQHSVLDKKAAVKFLREDWVDDPDVVARFFDEARTMERLNEHPNIVKIIDVATQEKCASEGLPPYFIMEYIDGRSLEDLIKSDEGFTLDDVIKITSCALLALQHCHNLGIVHRDVKPSNILITGAGEVKLTDFGIAKARQNTSKTGEGLTLGSTDYMSPEQALGKKDLDHRSDIYSLGITLYQMVCDRLPFEGDSPNAVALKHIQEAPVPPIKLNDAVPQKLNDLIMKAIEKDREHRFQSCQEMLEAIQKIDDPEEEVVEVDIPTVDLTNAILDNDADVVDVRDYDASTTSMVTNKLAGRPPVELINSIRVVLIIIVFTGIFLGAFKGYYLLIQARVNLSSCPAGAEVFVNGTLVGTTPIDLNLPPMGYLISFSKDQYATSTLYFDVKARENLSIEPRLLLLKPDFSSFDSAFKNLETCLKNMPSANFKTKKEQEKYENALIQLAQAWKTILSELPKVLDYLEPNLRLIELSKKYSQLGKLEGLYNKIAGNKDSATVYTMLGMVKKEQQDRKEALNLFMKAWMRDPNNRILLNTLGDFFLEENNHQKAKQYLEMSLFLYPEQEEIKEKLETLK